MVAALPTKELTTVGRIPLAKPPNPNTRRDHFSALGSKTVVGWAPPRAEVRGRGKTCVERKWYTHVEG